ncbi:hypothetical protein Vadar_014648 [Vaccinium darrowii]|uniref:Uncharacterized protein n=1 Tax=Vaccinium darrowii TaxID=229202 RepID=A0ACB7YLP9_9ERIC|nr:hypothetical protein Vadar_014648 [Vaccinium darrowii]
MAKLLNFLWVFLCLFTNPVVSQFDEFVYNGFKGLNNNNISLNGVAEIEHSGYLAPELTRTGKPTASSDVFAFGALLLEIACGRRPIEPKAIPEELVLVEWVWDKWKQGAVLEVVDRRLGGEFDEVEVVVVVKLGLMCSNSVAGRRPSMRQVVRYLEGEVALPEEVVPPGEFDGGKRGGGGIEFEDFVHSYPSSSGLFEKVSMCSSMGDGDANVDVVIEAGLSCSTLSITGGRDGR